MPIETIALIGAGPLSRGIACTALTGGYRLILEDVLPERLAAALEEIRGWLDRALARGTCTAEQKDLCLARLSTVSSADLACREAYLVIETLPEEMETKIDIFCIFEKFARPGAILVTTASSLSVTEIAAVTTRAPQCVGLRFLDRGQQRRVPLVQQEHGHVERARPAEVAVAVVNVPVVVLPERAVRAVRVVVAALWSVWL